MVTATFTPPYEHGDVESVLVWCGCSSRFYCIFHIISLRLVAFMKWGDGNIFMRLIKGTTSLNRPVLMEPHMVNCRTSICLGSFLASSTAGYRAVATFTLHFHMEKLKHIISVLFHIVKSVSNIVAGTLKIRPYSALSSHVWQCFVLHSEMATCNSNKSEDCTAVEIEILYSVGYCICTVMTWCFRGFVSCKLRS